MKTMALVFQNADTPQVIDLLRRTFEEVFARSVEVTVYFMDRIGPSEQICADVLVVNRTVSLLALRPHTPTVQNVVFMTRSIRKTYLDSILAIPAGTDVLLVNDTADSAREMIVTLYELGIGHLNLIPFEAEREKSGAYREIAYAITPNEPQLVPPYIPHVLNTEYRVVGFDTMVNAAAVLNLTSDRIASNLIRYISGIVEPLHGYRTSYFNSFLKERLLNEYVYDAASAIFAADPAGRIIYHNRRAAELFRLDGEASRTIRDCLPPELLEALDSAPDLRRCPVSLNAGDFLVRKSTIIVGEETLGCFVSLQDEITLRGDEAAFRRRLREKGFYAKHTFSDILHRSASMDKCIALAKKAAATEYTLLIEGESGTGKELFAQAIHNASPRRDQPFIAVNCAAISESLLESELFGYEEGAFTGAKKKGRLGYFEMADQGTIFLDEIGDISPRLQLGLLRVLQEKQVMRVGSDRIVSIDVRVVAATNKDLWREVELGHFRRDLFFRLHTISILLPPLRQRQEDIPALFRDFMGKDFYRISPEQLTALQRYDWPGNIRELENCALYCKAMGELPQWLLAQESVSGSGTDRADLQTAVLRAVAAGESVGSGAGRERILHTLRDQGLRLSDAALRKVLRELAEEGLLAIGSGRQGTRLTDAGRCAFTRAEMPQNVRSAGL